MEGKFDSLRELLLNGLLEVDFKNSDKPIKNDLADRFMKCATNEDLAKTIRKGDGKLFAMIRARLNDQAKDLYDEFQKTYVHTGSQNTAGTKSHHESGVANKSSSFVTSINVKGNQQNQHPGACSDEQLKMDPKGDSHMRMDVEDIEKKFPKQEWHDHIEKLKGCFHEKEELYRQAEEKMKENEAKEKNKEKETKEKDKEKEASGKPDDLKPASDQGEQLTAQKSPTVSKKPTTPPTMTQTDKDKKQGDLKSKSMYTKREDQVPDTEPKVPGTAQKLQKPSQKDPTPSQKAKLHEQSRDTGHGDQEWKTMLQRLKEHLEARDRCIADYEEEHNEAVAWLDKAKQTADDLRAKLQNETEMKEKYKVDVETLTVQKNEAKENLNSQQEEMQREKANFENEMKKLYKENKTLQKELGFQKQKYDEDMKAKNKQLEQLKIEKDDYRDRFSKMAGDRLTDKNADIADLSDPNRAMKLSEKFSGLYDDEWTDAYQTLCDNKMPKKDALQLLVRILKSCYDSCEFIATQQIATLTDNLVFPVQTVGKVTKEQAGIKAKPRLGSKNERILRDARRQMWEASIDVIKQSLLEQTKEWMDKEIGKKAFDDTKPYIEKCVEISWLMVIHEPPIYMKTETTPDENMDPNIYTAYSASGKKIDFLVWPPLYNGKGGGLLSKGVVELMKTVTKDKK